jgi:hypothetical protein
MVVSQLELLVMLREMVLQRKRLMNILQFKEHVPLKEVPSKSMEVLHCLLMNKV